ncbi:ribonuclease E inhibitor RraA/Dimethylmenaquinone methyltransferase [Phycomyces nitens]|nr:ribonuclease E inhibitor RraA/Dimethylmenaquinone methyltransferase [Phycomyces nitens]
METPLETLEALGQFSTCEVADALLKLGERPWGGYIADIDMWSPAYCQGETKIIGPAFTVKLVDKLDKDAPSPSEHFADNIPSGSVVVVSAPPDVKNAVWGGLMSARAMARQAKGVVIDGRVRDLNEHRSMQFPVFAKSHSILPQNAFLRPSAIHMPLSMSTSSVVVYPGDIIMADVEGVVCIPKKLLDGVVKNCTENVAIDSQCMEALVNGAGVKETFAKFRGTL